MATVTLKEEPEVPAATSTVTVQTLEEGKYNYHEYHTYPCIIIPFLASWHLFIISLI